ncbi:hypothetical protein [Motiliproteus sp. SC1-56]|uniref:hypothetical protein n=1 Tax=Motiliproteus sp. SC1-56 TaxID=2799565 RepID=UPI001A8D2A77|nr:hypothetical protein [Motiliproteus sp. SC1-56]
MNAKVISHLGVVSLVLGAGVLHANLYQPSEQELSHRIAVMERAVADSSVTPLYSAEQRNAKLDLIESARRHSQAGNQKTALAQLEEAGRKLYPMAPRDDIVLSGDKQRQWLDQLARGYDSLLPVAQEIAAQEGADPARLHDSRATFDAGLAALERGDLDAAERQMTEAYRALQGQLVALRSGEELVIAQPDPGTAEAWREAERRYADWRFFADWMGESAQELGVDPSLVQAGSAAADRIYQQASAKAEAGEWMEATRQIDAAYRVMENHWRQAGIDI